jgi:hypothetical protein
MDLLDQLRKEFQAKNVAKTLEILHKLKVKWLTLATVCFPGVYLALHQGPKNPACYPLLLLIQVKPWKLDV